MFKRKVGSRPVKFLPGILSLNTVDKWPTRDHHVAIWCGAPAWETSRGLYRPATACILRSVLIPCILFYASSLDALSLRFCVPAAVTTRAGAQGYIKVHVSYHKWSFGHPM